MAMTPEQQSNEHASQQAADSRTAGQTNGKADSVAPLGKRFLWADSSKGVNRLIIGLIVLCVLLFAMEFVWHRHVKVPWESLFGFHAIAGFVSFTVIVLGARLLRVFIRRDESFYAPTGVDAEEYPEAGTLKLPHSQRPADSISTLRDELMGRRES